MQVEKPKFYNIGYQLSPYWQAFKAFDQLEYASGSLSELYDLVEKRQFWTESIGTGEVVLSQAQMKLSMKQEAVAAESSTAPDHVFRLYAYNDLLRNIGKQYFNRQALEDQWLRQAEEAFVVSPISSLIVLETDQDYDRFGIEANENSLENANIPTKQQKKSGGFGKLIGSSGATPEPHEWVLIVLVGALALWQLKKVRF